MGARTAASHPQTSTNPPSSQRRDPPIGRALSSRATRATLLKLAVVAHWQAFGADHSLRGARSPPGRYQTDARQLPGPWGLARYPTIDTGQMDTGGTLAQPGS